MMQLDAAMMHAKHPLICICTLQRHSWVLPKRQHWRTTACALMSDHGYLLIQAIFQALQLYSWGFALIKLLRNTL